MPPRKRSPQPAAVSVATDEDTSIAAIAFLSQRYIPDAPLAQYARHPKNPKDHDLGLIHSSVETNGYYGAALVWKRREALLGVRPPKGKQWILAGHGRHETLEQRDVPTWPVIEVDCDPGTAARILLVDNASTDAGGFRDDVLFAVLKGLHESGGDTALLGTGYVADDIEHLRIALEGITFTPAPNTAHDPDASPHPAIIKVTVDVKRETEVVIAIRELCAQHPEWRAVIAE